MTGVSNCAQGYSSWPTVPSRAIVISPFVKRRSWAYGRKRVHRLPVVVIPPVQESDDGTGIDQCRHERP